MISKAYVFIDGLADEPIICGVTQIDSRTNTGYFRYGKSYLARADAFPLDPVQLPLGEQQYQTTFNLGLFGVLSDAGPDAWGEKVILSLHHTKPKNRLELLLAGSGMGTGSLVFSLSRSSTKPKYNKNTLGDIPMLLKAKDAVLADEVIPNEAKKALEFGSSMGGARPKTIIQHQDTAYLAKFNRPDDFFNVVKVEHATMQMLAELTCNVAPTQVIHSAGGDVLLVERFDLKHAKPTSHFLSAHSIFNLEKLTQSSLRREYTYGYLAEFLMRHADNPTDAHDLYRRMAFNVLIGNTDDHARNHAVLYNFAQKGWKLSPAYDVLPVNQSKQHGMGIGEQGRVGSVENLLSQSRRFGLKQFKAQKIIDEVQQLSKEWQYYFNAHGVRAGDIERLKAVMPIF